MINLRSFTMSLVFFITRNKLPPIALLVVCAEARLESLPFLLMRLAMKVSYENTHANPSDPTSALILGINVSNMSVR